MLGMCLAVGFIVLAVADRGLSDEFVEWVDTPYVISLAEAFTKVNEAHAGSATLVLQHNVDVTVSVSEPGAGESELRCAAPGSTDTLGTSYKLSGAGLTPSDADWVDAAQFVGRNYTLVAPGGEPYNSSVQLDVRAVTASDRANDRGQYTAAVTVTAVQIP